MRRPRGTRLALLLGLALTAAASSTAAQTPAQSKRFAAAQSRYEQGSFATAYEEFRALAAETGSPNAEVYVARCLRELGRLPEAYEAMSVALRHATAKAQTEPKYASTRNAAAADLALLEPKVGRLLVAVADPPAGLTLTVDGTPLPPDKLGVAVAEATGEVIVHLAAPGRADVERRLTLRGGELTTLTLALEGSSGGPLRDVPARGGGRIAGFTVLGLGVAGMATFAGAGVAANRRYDSISAACGGMRCTNPSFAGPIEGGKQLDVAADVGLGVGLAGLAAGALLVIFGGPKAAGDAVRATAWAAPCGGGTVIGVRSAFY